jgi:predicted secreted protein
VKSLLSTIPLLLLTALVASAGDVAEMRPIGFSPDGRFFAFEQFGEQDGSGFPYAEIQVIDTETDEYVEGTPITTLIRREEASTGEARRESLNQAKAMLDSRKIGEDPGFIVAFSPIGELTEKPHDLRYQSFPSFYVNDGIYRLSLQEFDAKGEERCRNMNINVRAFALSIAADTTPDAKREVYRDQSVPKSRNCPSAYAIGGVVTPGLGSKAPHMVMVQVASLGFEGSNLRWIAVPVKP